MMMMNINCKQCVGYNNNYKKKWKPSSEKDIGLREKKNVAQILTRMASEQNKKK